MTLVEVIVALLILTGALLGMAAFMTRLSHSVTESRLRTRMVQLANDRLEDAKAAYTYAAIDTLAGTERAVAGNEYFSRRTSVQRVGGLASDTLDHRIVTVVVTAPVTQDSVRLTTIISGF